MTFIGLARLAFGVAHALIAAAWFGGMFYSYTVLQPGAHGFFESAERCEAFLSRVGFGVRWKVVAALSAMAACDAMHVILQVLADTRPGALWMGALCFKALVLVAAACAYVHISWRMWPARLLATGEDLALWQARFTRVSLLMMALAALNIALGTALLALR